MDAGANPNSIDVDGLTPLHLLAINVGAVNISAVFKLLGLLDFDAHLDKVNVEGVTPLDLFKYKLSEYKSQEGPNVFSLINVVRPLSCYCAKLICEENISFEREDVPPPVFDILRLHGANI